jgi:glycosyltransferase involved in cell wall biosynthesis
MPPRLAIVVPCYNEDLVLAQTADVLRVALHRLTVAGRIAHDSFVYFVDDGSQDGTWEIIRALHAEGHGQFRGLRLARNAGHQKALLAGLLSVRRVADIAISMDADLQDDPAVLDQFVAQHAAGHDIVYGVRRRRDGDRWPKRATAGLFYRLMGWLGVQIVRDHADYRLTSQRVLRELGRFAEANLFLRGLFPSMGFRCARVYYDREVRKAGRTKYSVGRMLAFAWEGITSFSIFPLRLVLVVGAALFCFSTGMMAWNLYHWARGAVLAGWMSTVLPIYILGAFQLMALGIVGEYLGKVYLETKRRPRYHKDEELL